MTHHKFYRLGHLLVLLAMLLATLAVSAKEVTIGKLKYKVNTTDKIAKCTGLATEATKNYNLTIPNTVEYDGVTLKVTTVEKEAFWFDNYLKKVTLSDNTETVGSKAFYSCDNLSIVSLGKKLKIIGAEAFAHCGLNGTFTSVTFPSTLEIIRKEAFTDCRYLVNVTFNDKLQEIGESAFWGCTSIKSLLLPGSLKTIGPKAFSACDALYDVTFADGKAGTVIGEDCFNNNKNLTLLSFYGPGVAVIGDGAFVGCAIQWLYLPSSVHTIAPSAFFGCQFTLIELSEGLTTIGESAFYFPWHADVKTLKIPSTVTSIGAKAFDLFPISDAVICNAVNPPAAGADAFWERVTSSVKLIVPPASLEKYRNAPVWKDFRYINDTDKLSVEEIEMSPDELVSSEEWYNLQGIPVSPDNCPPGLYIVRSNGKIEKRIVR